MKKSGLQYDRWARPTREVALDCGRASRRRPAASRSGRPTADSLTIRRTPAAAAASITPISYATCPGWLPHGQEDAGRRVERRRIEPVSRSRRPRARRRRRGIAPPGPGRARRPAPAPRAAAAPRTTSEPTLPVAPVTSTVSSVHLLSVARRDVRVQAEDVRRVVAVLERGQPLQPLAVGGVDAGGALVGEEVGVDARRCAGAAPPTPRAPRPMCRSPSGSDGGQPATMLISKPTSRSPTAVAPGSTRLTAPPMAQPLICENGDVIASTRADDDVDHLVGEVGQPVRLPVVVPPVRRAAVEHRLQRDVRRPGAPARRSACRSRAAARSPARPRRGRRPRRAPAPSDRRAVLLRRQERHRRGHACGEGDAELVGRLGSEVAQEAQDLRAPRAAARRSARRAPSARPGAARYSKRGGDAEVAAAAAQPPEQLRLGLGVDVHPLAVGGHEVDGEQVVDGQAVLAHEVPEPAAERQPADAGVADDPAGGGEPELLGGAVELAPEDAAGRARGARRRVDRIAFISERSIITPPSQTAWPATAWPPPRTETSRSRSRAKRTAVDDVVGAGAAGDQRRAAVDRAVPDPAGLVVAFLARPQQRAAEPRAQLRRAPPLDRVGISSSSSWRPAFALLLATASGPGSRAWSVASVAVPRAFPSRAVPRRARVAGGLAASRSLASSAARPGARRPRHARARARALDLVRRGASSAARNSRAAGGSPPPRA